MRGHFARQPRDEEQPAISAVPTPTDTPADSVPGYSDALDAWWAAPEADAFPYRAVIAGFSERGKHFAPAALTSRMVRIRDARERVAGETTEQQALDAFLDAALDKVEGRYDYATYCGLKVLNLGSLGAGNPDADEVLQRRDQLLLAVLGDLVAYEWSVADGGHDPLPLLQPDSEHLRRRVKRALGAMRPSLSRMGCPAEQGSAQVATFLTWRAARLGEAESDRMARSLLPVHRVHDEYLFLRVLQAFEVNFAAMAVLLEQAIRDIERNPDSALAQLVMANRIQREAARLFPLLGTMLPEAFQDFRRFTEGASAIQSAGYKSVEALCRVPDRERLDSVAYRSVPEVRAWAKAGPRTLEVAFEEACRNGSLAPSVRKAIAGELQAFSEKLLGWRQAHYQMARKYLGARGGTGYTEGVPYLERVRHVPVFSRPMTPGAGA
ncbi:tryptophan 2,3-dioxygenase [Aliiruegeria haliotis]|uniref:Tryptophan 2,3-dioxygenase n=1 Tax=Aliiruegeria haliotis TaxID=1280846 RepID=A0A2T0RRW8_9RHOB|nr:tryptophan 2,3-dioxygenase [Aliiruegeria haliotis]PRY23850.1 tryptophan 2,3-dioxygenase [Aliiruegeria haliotis]